MKELLIYILYFLFDYKKLKNKVKKKKKVTWLDILIPPSTRIALIILILGTITITILIVVVDLLIRYIKA